MRLHIRCYISRQYWVLELLRPSLPMTSPEEEAMEIGSTDTEPLPQQPPVATKEKKDKKHKEKVKGIRETE